MKRCFLHILLIVLMALLLTVSISADELLGEVGQPENYSYFDGTLKTSPTCIEMLKDMEGYIQKPMGDYQQLSIGYGCNTSYLKKYSEKLAISDDDLERILSSETPNFILKEEKAEALMMYVIQEIEEDLDAFLTQNEISVNQYQYDSLVSFTYNLGTLWMTPHSRLGSVLCSGKYTVNEFASAMGVYCHVTTGEETKVLPLLIDRRIREIKLFLYGAYELDATEVKFCTLTYNGAGGSVATDIGFYQVGEPYQILFGAEPKEATAEEPGTLPFFVGWYNENGEKVTAATIAEKSGSVTAVWSDFPEDPELQQDGEFYQQGIGPIVGETEYNEPAPPVDITTVFSDMKQDDWHYDYVRELYTKSVIDGYPDGTFRPDNTVTTGEALKMILLAAGYEKPEPVASHWARNFLNLALDEVLIDRGDITDLDIPISRAMMAKIVVRALKLTPATTGYFPDTDDAYAQTLYEYSISTGYNDGTFRPHRSLTRAELCTIVCRMYQYR